MKNKLLIISLFVLGVFSLTLSAQAYYPEDVSCYAGATYSTLTGQRCNFDSSPLVCCESFGYGAYMIKTPSSYEMVPQNQCLVGQGFVGGGRNIVSNNYCQINTNPIISGVSGPQTLNANQTGTWRVTAMDPNGRNLSYSVNWGDQYYILPMTSSSIAYPFQQSATFTHTYTQPGTYTPTFTVTSENTIRCITTPCPSNGGSATTSLNVQVKNLYNNFENDCLQGQMYSSVTGQRCSVIIDNGCSYGNRYSVTTGQLCGVCSLSSGGVGCGNLDNKYTFDRTLRRGLNGEDVRKLQELLGLIADGVYGRETADRVRTWQIENGLYGDGIFGPNSRSQFDY
jgi:peptidoglycan hydrolase-like protein with peptidoglycan-binding domain